MPSMLSSFRSVSYDEAIALQCIVLLFCCYAMAVPAFRDRAGPWFCSTRFSQMSFLTNAMRSQVVWTVLSPVD